MPEDYEAIYTHPGGATAIFTRRDGSLDAVAKGLDSEQFWVFKNVKALLVRNDEGDLEEATRQMAVIGFAARVRRLEPVLARTGAIRPAAPEPFVVTAAEQAGHHGPHVPAPSYWPLMLGVSMSIAMCGLIVVQTAPYIAALGMLLTFASIIGWGVEPFEA